ncbi:unnamed protein product [Vicia faba]|uniref:Uncharacterized protein n=1 Tax=Vicia faba TaxID=3906 RepID=A0AAV0ZCE6_VICFA|nr:unnamed protein product [Vicia faba]
MHITIHKILRASKSPLQHYILHHHHYLSASATKFLSTLCLNPVLLQSSSSPFTNHQSPRIASLILQSPSTTNNNIIIIAKSSVNATCFIFIINNITMIMQKQKEK